MIGSHWWELVAVVGCCWWLSVVAGCCWLLLVVVGSVVGCCWLLFSRCWLFLVPVLVGWCFGFFVFKVVCCWLVGCGVVVLLIGA